MASKGLFRWSYLLVFLLLASASLSKADEPKYIQVNLSNARVVAVVKRSSNKSFFANENS